MYQRIAVALLLGVCAPLANAEVVELSPDLYLAIQTSRGRGEDVVAIKIAAIAEANKFAASTGKVAAPITGRMTWLGSFLKQYEYQFRVMTRAEALAAKPTFADVVVSVDGANTCGAHAAPTVAALMPELRKLDLLREPKETEPAPVATPPEAPSPTPGVPDPTKPWLSPPLPDASAPPSAQ